MEKFYITTPIYYANSDPHIGSAYTTIAADIVARWNRLLGKKVFFLTGTDEHGQKIQETAKKEGIGPKAFVDAISLRFKEAFRSLSISNDNFIRTTDKNHEKEVGKILQLLYKKGFIYKGEYEAYYCIGCEQYLAKSDLVTGKCPLHKKEPEAIKEESYLLRLSGFQNLLVSLIKKGELYILPMKRRNEVLSFIKSGLKDISISRRKSKVEWGIELPFDREHTCYVWIDAFWSYLTGLKSKKHFSSFWPPDIQLMANDIIRVHSTIWPALLLALGINLPKKLFVHGYFTVNKQKISKSLGNAISTDYLVKKYGSDAIRYYLIREIPFGEDGDFSEEALKNRLNNELANDLGNLVSRVINLADKNFKNGLKGSVDKKLSSKLNLKVIGDHMDNLEMHHAISEIWRFINECNKHVTSEKLWEMKGKKLETHLYTLLESLRIISILLSSFIPETSKKINKQLNVKDGKLKECKFGIVKKYSIKKSEILFKKV